MNPSSIMDDMIRQYQSCYLENICGSYYFGVDDLVSIHIKLIQLRDKCISQLITPQLPQVLFVYALLFIGKGHYRNIPG